ncbi:MAG: replication-associated recombination protein A [Planctomycetota bacterium]|nr:MAG: replication-associated recombination protein A [Planctomycetota bacterium]
MATSHAMASPRAPLPERIRPQQLDEIVGQDHLLGDEGIISQFLAAGHLPSLLLWGPPGCGKTTLARLLAQELGMHFQALSAVLDGVAQLRKQVEEAEQRQAFQKTLLFIDEIHRFSKAQQDALLPHVERGTVVLVGATTENPSFTVTAALASRCRTFALQALTGPALHQLLERCRQHPQGVPDLAWDDAAETALQRLSMGDGRRALLLLEEAHALSKDGRITAQAVLRVAQGTQAQHDRQGEAHYDVASAFIKSMRASDVQAALYYLARQLEAGEDPRFVARRVVIFASEDVGLADPQALVIASAAFRAVADIGMPEAIYPLSQAVIYCATSPKSNTTKAYFAAAEAVRNHPGAAVPMSLRNAPTGLMKDMGYGDGYQYDHDCPDHFSGQECLPEVLRGAQFYEPGGFGHEREIARRLAWWQQRRDADSGRTR